MNERIQELVKQVYGSQATEQEIKLAELIVEECRTVVNDLYHKTTLELCGPLLTADEEIAKHFYGVEE